MNRIEEEDENEDEVGSLRVAIDLALLHS